jgi:hypothetical protein
MPVAALQHADSRGSGNPIASLIVWGLNPVISALKATVSRVSRDGSNGNSMRLSTLNVQLQTMDWGTVLPKEHRWSQNRQKGGLGVLLRKSKPVWTRLDQ